MQNDGTQLAVLQSSGVSMAAVKILYPNRKPPIAAIAVNLEERAQESFLSEHGKKGERVTTRASCNAHDRGVQWRMILF